MGQAGHTAGHFECKSCGWSGSVSGRPRCLACYRRRTSAWRKANPEKALDLQRRMDKKARTERPEQYNAKKRAQRARNPQTNRLAQSRRREWLQTGDVTRDDLMHVAAVSRHRCFYCNQLVRFRYAPADPRGFDHIIPRAAGGLHTKRNLRACCADCNARKSDKVGCAV